MSQLSKDGFTLVPNDLLEAVIRYPFAWEELRVFILLLYATGRCGERFCSLSCKEIAMAAGLTPGQASGVLKRLQVDRVVVSRPQEPWRHRPPLLGIQKDVARWKRWTAQDRSRHGLQRPA